MRKILAALALLLGVGLAHADTSTTRFSLTKPTIGTTGWGTKTNNNWDIVDSACMGLSAYNNVTASSTFTNANTFTSTTTLLSPVFFSSMTATRVPFFGALGLFQDDADFTFNGTTATLTGVVATSASITARLDMNSQKIVNVANGSASGDAVNFGQLSGVGSGYSFPPLVWISTNAVDIASNTNTANQTCISFNDQTSRCVTENTASADKYRRFLATATANFTSGTEDSGLRSTYVRTANTYYSLYAVKSQINSSNFVIVGDTITPVSQNYATLDSAYGANSWVFIGTIANGDNSGATTAIAKFMQSGNRTVFVNSETNTVVTPSNGLRLSSTAGATSITWTYAIGTSISSAQLPENIKIVTVNFAGAETVANTLRLRDGSNTFTYCGIYVPANTAYGTNSQCTISAGAGAVLADRDGSSIAMEMTLVGFEDSAIKSGMNFTH